MGGVIGRRPHDIYTHDYWVDDYEHVRVDIEGQYPTSGGTAYYSTTTQTGPIYSNPDFYYYSDTTSGYTGSLTLVQSLGGDALASLSDDGVVDFTLTSIVGDIVYIGYTLTVIVVENPVPGLRTDAGQRYTLAEIEVPDITLEGLVFGDDSDAAWDLRN